MASLDNAGSSRHADGSYTFNYWLGALFAPALEQEPNAYTKEEQIKYPIDTPIVADGSPEWTIVQSKGQVGNLNGLYRENGAQVIIAVFCGPHLARRQQHGVLRRPRRPNPP